MENRSFGLHSPAAAGDLGAERKARRPGPDTSREGGRLCRSAPRSLALFNTPWPTWRTLKLHCALFSQPQPFPTLHRAATRARAGGARARAGAGTARHGARVPLTPGPPAAGLARLPARSARPPRFPPCAVLKRRSSELGARAGPGKAGAQSGRDSRACVPGAGTCHRWAAAQGERSAVREVQGLRNKNAREIIG